MNRLVGVSSQKWRGEGGTGGERADAGADKHGKVGFGVWLVLGRVCWCLCGCEQVFYEGAKVCGRLRFEDTVNYEALAGDGVEVGAEGLAEVER